MIAPECKTMLFCETLLVDPHTGKRYIIGEFTGLRMGVFPCCVPMFTIYIVLSGGRGKMPIAVRGVCMETDHVILEMDGVAEFTGALSESRSPILLKYIEFPCAGTYSFTIKCGELCTERKLEVGQGPG
jgi:hypothetical protein